VAQTANLPHHPSGRLYAAMVAIVARPRCITSLIIVIAQAVEDRQTGNLNTTSAIK
jgi:hypothetical protein